jgi:CHASE2 domain-containing sensor protein
MAFTPLAMKTYWYQSIIITVFVFFMLWVASLVSNMGIFSALDTISVALKDFRITDYVFSNLREDPLVDERIVLVNIGTLDRRGMAQEIQILNSFHPRVIAYDGFFNCEGGLYDTLNCPQLLDTLGNLMLASAIADANKFVLGSKLMQTDSVAQYDVEYYDSLEVSDPMFTAKAHVGFVSLPTDATYQEDVKLCRTIFPQWVVNGKRELAFSTQIANQYDSMITKKYLDRNLKEEWINFRGNIEVRTFRFKTEKMDQTSTTNFKTMFYAVDPDQLFRGEVEPEMFRDKIVIMGYLGDYLGDPAWEDKFFTPLNNKVAGRANPDMFGPVLHANVVAMILNEDYINTIPDIGSYFVAFVVCLFTIALFILIDRKLPVWFDALSFIIQVVLLIGLTTIIIWSFAFFNLMLELSLAMGVTALVGPCYDIYKSLQNEWNRRFAKPAQVELTKTEEQV